MAIDLATFQRVSLSDIFINEGILQLKVLVTGTTRLTLT